MFGKNNKVPVAILSCFLIAFILQGILKISGVFIFEKALSWEIFKIIDSHKWSQIIYYSLINCLSVYCLSFALTSRPFSNKWYHYAIIMLGTSGITTCRMLIKTPFYVEFIYDALLYIVIPMIINITTNKKYKLSASIVTTTAIHVLLYFVYLGLGYWSILLNSILPINQIILPASTSFLIRFETYIGLAMLMLSLNLFIRKEN